MKMQLQTGKCVCVLPATGLDFKPFSRSLSACRHVCGSLVSLIRPDTHEHARAHAHTSTHMRARLHTHCTPSLPGTPTFSRSVFTEHLACAAPALGTWVLFSIWGEMLLETPCGACRQGSWRALPVWMVPGTAPCWALPAASCNLRVIQRVGVACRRTDRQAGVS